MGNVSLKFHPMIVYMGKRRKISGGVRGALSSVARGGWTGNIRSKFIAREGWVRVNGKSLEEGKGGVESSEVGEKISKVLFRDKVLEGAPSVQMVILDDIL